ncbi:MAG TPA: hypothetical protein VN706_11200 [Gemmatimonadaceae bacterium]|nr:hypothetical protein [Gemmatimonadaceae bacterium]
MTFRAFGELVAFGATTDGGRAADFVRDCWSRSSGDMATPECYPWLDQDPAGVWQAPSGARVAWLKDPDGNLLSVAQYPE